MIGISDKQTVTQFSKNIQLNDQLIQKQFSEHLKYGFILWYFCIFSRTTKWLNYYWIFSFTLR